MKPAYNAPDAEWLATTGEWYTDSQDARNAADKLRLIAALDELVGWLIHNDNGSARNVLGDARTLLQQMKERI